MSDVTVTSEREPRVKIKRPPILFMQTQALMVRLRELLGCPVFTYWNSPGGSVCGTDVNAFYEVLHTQERFDRIALFVRSSGGSGQDALRIVHMLRQHAKEFVALVPLECASAATMIALGADEIQMGPLAFLTAVDTSLCHELSPVDRHNRSVSVSQDELSRVVRLWQSAQAEGGPNPYQFLYQHIHPLVVGASDRASSLSIRICSEILSYHMANRERAEEISQRLNSDYPSHNYPITQREAERLGLNVSAMPDDVHTLLLSLAGLYSEIGQPAVTDFDEFHQHNHEIINLIEGEGVQIIFQNDKDWTYLRDERRWISLNDESGWFRVEQRSGKLQKKKLHF